MRIGGPQNQLDIVCIRTKESTLVQKKPQTNKTVESRWKENCIVWMAADVTAPSEERADEQAVVVFKYFKSVSQLMRKVKEHHNSSQ